MNAQIPSMTDQGMACFVMLLRFHGIGADPAQIKHQLGNTNIGIQEMLLCAKQFGLKGRLRNSNWARLGVTPLPAL